MPDMSANQYRKALKALDLTIVGAAPVLGINRRQSQRFAHSDAKVPLMLAKLLRLAIAHNITADELKGL